MPLLLALIALVVVLAAGALEAAGTRGWTWRPAERPDETIAETTPPIPSSRFSTGYSGLRRICLDIVPALSSVS